MKDSKPWWEVFSSNPVRDLISQETFKLPDGNFKKIGGDIHSTLDSNPNSPTFGNVHSTVRLPGIKPFHF